MLYFVFYVFTCAYAEKSQGLLDERLNKNVQWLPQTRRQRLPTPCSNARPANCRTPLFVNTVRVQTQTHQTQARELAFDLDTQTTALSLVCLSVPICSVSFGRTSRRRAHRAPLPPKYDAFKLTANTRSRPLLLSIVDDYPGRYVH